MVCTPGAIGLLPAGGISEGEEEGLLAHTLVNRQSSRLAIQSKGQGTPTDIGAEVSHTGVNVNDLPILLAKFVDFQNKPQVRVLQEIVQTLKVLPLLWQLRGVRVLGKTSVFGFSQIHQLRHGYLLWESKIL